MAPVRGAKKAVRMRMSRLAASVDCLHDTSLLPVCEFSSFNCTCSNCLHDQGAASPWHDSRTRYGRDYEVSP